MPTKPKTRPGRKPARVAMNGTMLYLDDSDRAALEELAERRRERRGDPAINLAGTIRDLIRAARSPAPPPIGG